MAGKNTRLQLNRECYTTRYLGKDYVGFSSCSTDSLRVLALCTVFTKYSSVVSQLSLNGITVSPELKVAVSQCFKQSYFIISCDSVQAM